jgi:hypothetical protein
MHPPCNFVETRFSCLEILMQRGGGREWEDLDGGGGGRQGANSGPDSGR